LTCPRQYAREVRQRKKLTRKRIEDFGLKAVVLAAGKGTRMKDLSADRPKHLIRLEDRPVLEHVVLRLKQAGITETVLVIGYLGHMIREHFGDGSRFGARIQYAVQDPPNGTGSGVHAARELVSDASFLMTFGDIVTPAATYTLMLEDYRAAPCDALLLLNWVEDPYRGAAVYLDDGGRITQVIEKPPIGTSTTHCNQSGIFIFAPIIFDYTGRLTPSARGEYELTHAINAMLEDGRNVRGCRLDSGAWCDVGTPDDLPIAERIIEASIQNAGG